MEAPTPLPVPSVACRSLRRTQLTPAWLSPRLDRPAWVHPVPWWKGNVPPGGRASPGRWPWPGRESLLRIVVGENSNVQDGAVLQMRSGQPGFFLGPPPPLGKNSGLVREVTVGPSGGGAWGRSWRWLPGSASAAVVLNA